MPKTGAMHWRQLTGWAAVEGQWLRRKHFGTEALHEIAQRIARSETSHPGELVVAVEAVMPSHEPDSHCRALEVFGRLKVWDTPHDTGVLLYLALDRHAIEIVADRGVPAPPARWHAVCAALGSHLRTGAYLSGVLEAIDGIEAVMREYCIHHERGPDDHRLPDQPVLL